MIDVLLTCPPMISQLEAFQHRFAELGWRVYVPEFEQALSESELVGLVPGFDAWIIGDDPASRRVAEAGANGRLKAAIKWGVGVDNVDFQAFSDNRIPVVNSPGMFGKEVADIALGYIVGVARSTFAIDRCVRAGTWPKPSGVSLSGKTATVVGFGDIGRNTARRLSACDMRVVVCDPAVSEEAVVAAGYARGNWPDALADTDFIVFTCALTTTNRHMLNHDTLAMCKHGVRIVNVARGPLIDEAALVDAQRNGLVGACAFDVFEEEPLPMQSPLRDFPENILGSHNASNTVDAVRRTSIFVIDKLRELLEDALP